MQLHKLLALPFANFYDMVKVICNKGKSHSQVVASPIVGRAYKLLLIICIFYCTNVNSQVVPVPVITLENTPACGETAILTASLPNNTTIPTGYIYGLPMPNAPIQLQVEFQVQTIIVLK